jgi:hypothetical protein
VWQPISRPPRQSCQHEGRFSYRRNAPRDWLIASKGVQTLEGVAQVWWRLLPNAGPMQGRSSHTERPVPLWHSAK